MAQTLTSLLVHIVFSTKDRQDLIDTNIEPRLYSYLGGIARKMESRLLDAGGTANHVHLLISRNYSRHSESMECGEFSPLWYEPTCRLKLKNSSIAATSRRIPKL